MKNLIVIKIGTGVLTRENGTLDGASLVRLVTAVAGLKAQGYPCVMVSSGAVGAGVSSLDLTAYPDDVETRQAAAAIGQARLMQRYQTIFEQFDLDVAQLLLTGADLQESRERISATMHRLLEEGDIIPIVNENDSVAIEELRVGDNDMLSARVAEFLNASQLIMFTTVDGLLDEEDQLIEKVGELSKVDGLIRAENGKFSIGGMASKLQAVEYATQAGIGVLVANGRRPEQLSELVEGRGRCTRFGSSSSNS
ncbi:MAG: glutamate 5-kinase [Akkermansiaceae bacterium]|jgi:glutamate 5-kinase